MTDAEKRLLDAVLIGESRDLEDLKEKVRRERMSPAARSALLAVAKDMHRAERAWMTAVKGIGSELLLPILHESQEELDRE